MIWKCPKCNEEWEVYAGKPWCPCSELPEKRTVIIGTKETEGEMK